jgi:effector-binding domain-containing protein
MFTTLQNKTKMKKQFAITGLLVAFILINACSNNDSKATTEKKNADTIKPVKQQKAEAPATKPAIINIIDTVATKRMVLCLKDSANSFNRVSLKLGQIYGVKLAELLKKNNLKMDGAPMAWYTTSKPPFFFEAGVPVAKKPAKLSGGAYVKELGADSVVIAHFYGPYELLSQGYDAVKEWMKEGKKKSTAAPYEIYIGDPMDSTGKMIDPYKVRTDIVFPRK